MRNQKLISVDEECPYNMDWRYCIICQMRSIECLQCPANSKQKNDNGEGHRSFANNVVEFNSVGALPTEINNELLE